MSSGSRGPLAEALRAKVHQSQAAVASELREAQCGLRSAQAELRNHEAEFRSTRAELNAARAEASENARQLEATQATADAERLALKQEARSELRALQQELEDCGARERDACDTQLHALQSEREAHARCLELLESQAELRSSLEMAEAMKVKIQSLSQVREEELQQQLLEAQAQLQAALNDEEATEETVDPDVTKALSPKRNKSRGAGWRNSFGLGFLRSTPRSTSGGARARRSSRKGSARKG